MSVVKFFVLAASLTALGLAVVGYHWAEEEETISPRFERSVFVPSQTAGTPDNVESASVSTPIGPMSGTNPVSAARGPAEVVRPHEVVLGAPASSATPSVLPATPMQRSVVTAPIALGPSPGSQVSKEVFAEDVIARRAAYGQAARTLPEEESGN